MSYSEIISKMTLEEKASLLSGGEQFRSKSIKRLNIPAMTFADGPHGLRKQVDSGDHLGLRASLPATCYPTSATIANSWDEKLGEELGTYLGKEAAFFGVNMLLGPGFNIKRSPLCGRNFEYFSEDPFLAGKMAAAYIRGIQSEGVSACPKHYAVNNQETLRQHSDSVLDQRTLREIYLTAFEMAITEGKALGIMTSYNKVNGIYASECPHLLSDILVKEWGFKGIVVTDWGGSNDRVMAVKAGGNLEMPTTGGDSDRQVVAAAREGKLSESRIDELLEDYLSVVFATKLPENPIPFDESKHHDFARHAAKKSIVLLKNDNALLPVKPGTKVAVVGDFADTPRYQGFGSSVVNPTKVERPLDALKNAGLEITYCKGFDRGGKTDIHLVADVAENAKNTDVVLMFIGLDEMSEVEGCDRPHMRVNQNQVDALEAAAKVNPNVIAVFCGGAPFETPWIDKCKAVIHGYLGGQASASALVDAIVGIINPSGKLAETWPISYEETPARKYYPGIEKTAEYREGIFVGYRYYDTVGAAVRFPFGFGLSYTTFEYSNLKIDGNEVSLTVRNTGGYPGEEVVQIYVGQNASKIFRAKKELKAFQKIFLEANEESKITIKLDSFAFRYYNVLTQKFEVDGGDYEIYVGSSSVDIRLEGTIAIEGTNAPNPYNSELMPSYYSGAIKDVSDEEFELLLGRPIPERNWNRKIQLELNDTFSQLIYARGAVGRLIYKIIRSKKKSLEKKGKPLLNIMFIYNMPFRGLAKSTGGIVNFEMTKAVVHIFNGHFFKGTGHLIRAFFRKKRAVKSTERLLKTASENIFSKTIKQRPL